MSLIDELGGYSKAKEILSRERNSENIDPVIYLNGNEILIDAICDALLDHRRQNNIFEEGDPVVMRGTSHYDICEFVEASTVLPMYMLKDENGCKFGINKKCVDHATDEEIKAGRRLEVNTIDSDIDKQVNLMDQFIADGGFDKAFADVFGLPESVVQSLKEVS